MEIKLQCGDTITIPEGCKAIVKGESVEIEKAQKFKDGDVLVVVIDNVECPFIFFNTTEDRCWHHVCLYPDGEIRRTWFFYRSRLANARFATEEEKRQLFDKMKEKGWLWNAEKKCVELNRWRAKKGEEYYTINSVMEISQLIERGDSCDNGLWNALNCFRTQKQATEAARRIREALRQYHEEIGE